MKLSFAENEELIFGMQREMQSYEKKMGMQNLVKAAEYLHAAAEIFEESGLSAKADQIFNILKKIATYQPGEFIEFNSLRPQDTSELGETLEFTSLPEPKRHSEVKPGDIIEFNRLPSKHHEMPNKHKSEEFSFESLLADDVEIDDQNITDRHTKGLTPEKMVKNIKDHGHPMNLADDGDLEPDSLEEDSLEEDLDKWLELAKTDQDQDDDLLNADILEEPSLHMNEESIDKTFEDSD